MQIWLLLDAEMLAAKMKNLNLKKSGCCKPIPTAMAWNLAKPRIQTQNRWLRIL
jgi:hypothetical protein